MYGTLSILATRVLNLATFNFTVNGATSVAGNLTVGASAGTGFTANGIVTAVGSTFTLNAAAIIRNNGEFDNANVGTLFAGSTGKYYQLQSASYRNVNDAGVGNRWNYFSLPLGVTITHKSNGIMLLSGSASLGGSYLGTIVGPTATGMVYMASGASGVTELGASFSISGAVVFMSFLFGSTTVVNNLSYPLLTGTLTYEQGAFILPLNVPNANIQLVTYGVGANTFKPKEGTLTCKSIVFSSATNASSNIDMSVAAMNLYVYGDINLQALAQPINTYTKGSGTIVLGCNPAGASNINFIGKSVEALVKAGSCIKNILSDFTTVSISGSGGTIKSGSTGVQKTITTTLGAYKANNISFKDIVIVNGVITTTGRNLGNNATVGTTLIFKKGGYPTLMGLSDWEQLSLNNISYKEFDMMTRAKSYKAALNASTTITLTPGYKCTICRFYNDGTTDLTVTYNNDGTTTQTVSAGDTVVEMFPITDVTVVNTSATTAGSYNCRLGFQPSKN